MTSRRAGYSLFEVLLAFAIMAMILSVLLPRQTDMLRRIQAVDAQALAHDYAMSRLALATVVGPLNAGTTTDTYRAWTVTETIQNAPLGGTNLSAWTVRVVIEDATGTPLAEAQTQVVAHEQP